jgi:hypothetical protein
MEVFGKDYDKSFEVIAAGFKHTFDSFECTINKRAPVCGHCGNKIISHGIEGGSNFHCCARSAGKSYFRDRI